MATAAGTKAGVAGEESSVMLMTDASVAFVKVGSWKRRQRARKRMSGPTGVELVLEVEGLVLSGIVSVTGDLEVRFVYAWVTR